MLILTSKNRLIRPQAFRVHFFSFLILFLESKISIANKKFISFSSFSSFISFVYLFLMPMTSSTSTKPKNLAENVRSQIRKLSSRINGPLQLDIERSQAGPSSCASASHIGGCAAAHLMNCTLAQQRHLSYIDEEVDVRQKRNTLYRPRCHTISKSMTRKYSPQFSTSLRLRSGSGKCSDHRRSFEVLDKFFPQR